MRRFRLSYALATGFCWLAPSLAHAGKYDLDLTGLGSRQGTTVVPDHTGFRSLSSELGTIIAPKPVDPADTLGLSGFSVSADVSINTFGGDRNYWRQTSDSDGAKVAPTLQLIGRKGLWPGLELGGGATHLFDSRMWAMMGYVKIAFHEGFPHLPIPAIGVRASFSRLLGAKDLNLTTAAIAVTVSHVFGVGKTFSLTPYVGYEALLISANSVVLDATPNCDEFADDYNEDCPGVTPGTRAEFAFYNAGVIVRHRPHLGLRFIFAIMRLSFEAMFVPPGGPSGTVDGVTAEDNSKFQSQFTFSVGFDF